MTIKGLEDLGSGEKGNFDHLRPRKLLRLANETIRGIFDSEKDLYSTDIIIRVQLAKELISLAWASGPAVQQFSYPDWERWSREDRSSASISTQIPRPHHDPSSTTPDPFED